jgi:hypothetical protein
MSDEFPNNEKNKRPEKFLPFRKIGNSILEAIQIGQLNWWLKYDTKQKKFETLRGIDEIEVVFLPVGTDRIPYKPYRFDSDVIENLAREPSSVLLQFPQLYQKVYNEFDTYIDIEDEYKHLFTACVFETYQQHKMNSTGYLFLQGADTSGKTRVLDLFEHLAYRPLKSASINVANVYEYIGTENEGLCTILEDEAQELGSEKNTEKMAIYRSGYRKGSVVPRILNPGSSDRQMMFYKTFCCKVFAGYYMPRKDRAFIVRCLPANFVQGYPKKDAFDEKGEDEARMEKLKSDILLWRMFNYDKPLPEIELPITGRVKEVWKSKILSVYDYNEAYKILLEMAEQFQKKRVKDLHGSLEAYVVKAVACQGRFNNWSEIEFSQIWGTLLKCLNVTDYGAYESKSANVEILGYEITKTRVGGILGGVLHGESNQRWKVGRTWKFEKEKLSRLLDRYGITESELETAADINDLKGLNSLKG